MTVAVAQDQIAAPDHAVPDDLVGRRIAPDHEQRGVGAKDTGGVAFPLGDRSDMIQQGPHLADRNRDVRSQRVLAEKFMEHVADRALAEGNTAAMSGRMP